MKQTRRNTNAAIPPLQPDVSKPVPRIAPSRKPDDITDAAWWKRLLLMERRRNGQVETVLTRHIATLEQQVSDLRSACFQNLSRQFAPTPNPKETK
jgi:hypothetical protein